MTKNADTHLTETSRLALRGRPPIQGPYHMGIHPHPQHQTPLKFQVHTDNQALCQVITLLCLTKLLVPWHPFRDEHQRTTTHLQVTAILLNGPRVILVKEIRQCSTPALREQDKYLRTPISGKWNTRSTSEQLTQIYWFVWNITRNPPYPSQSALSTAGTYSMGESHFYPMPPQVSNKNIVIIQGQDLMYRMNHLGRYHELRRGDPGISSAIY